MNLCQTRLGDIHDGDVWIDTLPRFLEEEQARTLAYFGSTTPFEPLRAGILALHLDRRLYRPALRRWVATALRAGGSPMKIASFGPQLMHLACSHGCILTVCFAVLVPGRVLR